MDQHPNKHPKITYTLAIERTGQWTLNLLDIKYVYETTAAGSANLLIGIEGRADDLIIKYNRDDLNKAKVKKFITTFENVQQLAFTASLNF